MIKYRCPTSDYQGYVGLVILLPKETQVVNSRAHVEEAGELLDSRVLGKRNSG